MPDSIGNEQLRSRLERILAPERVLTRPIDRVASASDASFYRLVPRAVVRPESVAEVRGLFRFCKAVGVPVTFRAAGTSLSGQAVTDGILADLSRGWNGCVVEEDGRRVRVQPGIVGGHVNRILRAHGRRIGPDPASIDACMMGGILANNASGMCCGVAENAYHTLAGLRVLLPGGVELDTSRPDAGVRLAEAAPDLAAGLLELRGHIMGDAALRERIRAKYLTKNTTGYSLNAFVDFDRADRILEHLMIGSEGTLGFIAEAVLKTLPDFPLKLTGLLYFKDVAAACSAIGTIRDSGARAIEIMDRAALRSVQDLRGAPGELASLPDVAAGLLVEYQCESAAEMKAARAAARGVVERLRPLNGGDFTEDPERQAALWKLRKGLYPSVGAMRATGTTAIIEDVAFPLPKLAGAVMDLQALFARHGYGEAIIFGHARDGNIHFVLTQSFGDDAAVASYEAFMTDLVRLVVDKYDGALKAEHGTGRNVAPFVETEWGSEALGVMRRLKELLDPDGILNPGVILNPDPRAHVSDLKDFPTVNESVDRCTECGFCESHCPSRNLTLTPRQRIVVHREIERLRAAGRDGEALRSLRSDYAYAGLDTCAADGLCAEACPVGIDTGRLVKHLRGEAASARARKLASFAGRHMGVLEAGVRTALRLGHLGQAVLGCGAMTRMTERAEKLAGTPLPKWAPGMPRASAGRLPPTVRQDADAVYFPSCLSRTMGGPVDGIGGGSLMETFLQVARRAGVRLWIPPDCAGLCCGMPFGSKGYEDASRAILGRTLDRMWAWTGGGRLPLIIDASSCAWTILSAGPTLAGEVREKRRRMRLLDAVEFAHDQLLPRLHLKKCDVTVVVHPNCAARKMGLDAKLAALAGRCARQALVPDHLECCATAGDRGLLFPELTRSATKDEAEDILSIGGSGFYSSNLTCEMGLRASTGKAFGSFLYLLERASRGE